MNRIPVLPTLLTLANGICGFAAIAYASKINLAAGLSAPLIDTYYLLAAGLIFLGMLFDVLDGYAARLSRTASEFGGQLDSLCDAITFGAAPAFLLLRLGLEWETQPLVQQGIAIIATVYLACAVLRLARFNVENTPESGTQKRFKGLPTPAAAGCVVSVVILRSEFAATWSGLDPVGLRAFVSLWAPLGTLLAALLMVSRFSYPHFGRQLLRGKRQLQFVVQAVLVLATATLAPHIAFFLVFWAYALQAPVRAALRQLQPRDVPEQSPGVE